MVRYQRGHREAFVELVRRHAPRLYNYIARSIGNLTAADEVTCRVFVQVVHQAPEFRPDARFATWLYTIAQELVAETLQSAAWGEPRRATHTGRAEAAVTEEGSQSGESGEPAEAEYPEESCVRSTIAPLRAHVGPDATWGATAGDPALETLAALPLEQRQVFLLRELAQLPFPAIAQVLGTTEDDAKSATRAVLERLREALSESEAHARKLK